MKKVIPIIVVILMAVGIGIFMFSTDKEEVGGEQKEMLKPNQPIISADKKRKALEASAGVKGKNGEDVQVPGLEISLTEKENKTTFTYKITNNSEQDLTLQYTTSQRYDYEIHKKSGGLIYRYSDGKSFLQVLKDEQLNKGDTVSFDITLPELESGEYVISVWSSAKGMNNSKHSKSFIIE